MAPTTTTARTDSLKPTITNSQKKRSGVCCFSFAAYAKTLIQHLRTTCKIPIQDGLSDSEFSALEISLRFTFPPDLRSILREGLPSSTGFPNWRSASLPQLRLLSSLPLLSLSNHHSHSDVVSSLWGPRPSKFLDGAPVLVPIYRHFYIPSTPDSGNPVFYVHGGRVYLSAFDLAGFFHRFHCFEGGDEFDDDVEEPRVSSSSSSSGTMNVPAWAATAPRRVEVWTDLAEETERRRRVEPTLGWWWGGDGLKGCLDEVFWRLREGGWGVEEVREMMMMDAKHDHDDVDDDVAAYGGGYEEKEEEGGVVWHVRRLSLKLLRGGWSAEDVAYSLGGFKEGFFLPPAGDSFTKTQTRQLSSVDG